jgi:hypothetical protein
LSLLTLRRCQLGASRRRFEDAQVLHDQGRWTGSIYLGGYAIEILESNDLASYEQQVGENSWSIFWLNYALLQLCYAIPELRSLPELDQQLGQLLTVTSLNRELGRIRFQ